MKQIFILLSFILLIGKIQANSIPQDTTPTYDPYKLVVKANNYKEKQIVLAFYAGENQYVFDTTEVNAQGLFVFEGNKKNMKPGIYMIITLPDNKFIQVLIDQKNRKFTIEFDAADLNKPVKAKGSPENEAFYAYLTFLADKNVLADTTRKMLAAEKDETQKKKYEKILKDLDTEVKAFQEKVFKAPSNPFLTKILRSSNEPVVPTFEGHPDTVQLRRYLYYKEHYFDNIDLGDSVMFRTPTLHQKVNFYIEKLTPVHPDSFALSVDRILKLMEPSKETWQHYVFYFTNYFSKSKYVGMDAVVVHCTENYLMSPKMAGALNAEKAKTFIDDVKRSKMTLIGKIAPNIVMFDKNKKPVALHDIQSPYVVMIFWKPDCGHCQKTMPDVTGIQERLKSKGVKILSICGQSGDKESDCWKFVEEKNLGSLLNVSDRDGYSNYSYYYDLRVTPKVFILDSKKEIISSKIGVEQIEEVMENLIEYNKKKEEEKASGKY
ncbi:MAG: redoxin domain-containing protein [Saprospiraceae bacterium]|nr:redoxin domain-containing protein [Saprospiraceae bacterium]